MVGRDEDFQQERNGALFRADAQKCLTPPTLSERRFTTTIAEEQALFYFAFCVSSLAGSETCTWTLSP